MYIYLNIIHLSTVSSLLWPLVITWSSLGILNSTQQELKTMKSLKSRISVNVSNFRKKPLACKISGCWSLIWMEILLSDEMFLILSASFFERCLRFFFFVVLKVQRNIKSTFLPKLDIPVRWKTLHQARFSWSIIVRPSFFLLQYSSHSSWFLEGIHVIAIPRPVHSLFRSRFPKEEKLFLISWSGWKGDGGRGRHGVNSISRASGWYLMPSLMCYLKVYSRRSPFSLLFSVILISVKKRIRD